MTFVWFYVTSNGCSSILFGEISTTLSPVDSKGDEIDQLKSGYLVSIIPIKEAKFMLGDFFCLTLDDGSKFTVKFLEWKLLALFYEIKF